MKHGYLAIAIICFALFWGCQNAAAPSASPASNPSAPHTDQTTQPSEITPRIQPSEDSQFPLEITEPQDSSVVKTQIVRVRGTTSPDANVEVNEQPVIVDDSGIFSVMVALEPGPNSIEIVATDNNENEEFRLITVIYQP